MRRALDTLHAEHVTLAALLRSILSVLSDSRERGTLPDFGVLRAMLFYIAEFPEKRHHRHESELLFPKLRARSPGARGLLDRLDDEHRRGDARIRELEHGLTAFELLGAGHRETFEQAATRYVDFHLAHIALEERDILPLAARVLEPEDWDEIEEAMSHDPDPLSRAQPDPDCRALFSRITFHASSLGDLLDARFHDPAAG